MVRINKSTLVGFQSGSREPETVAFASESVELVDTKPIRPRPIKDPDYAAVRKEIMARFSKTLAYLAK
jgi:hypothetical protein